MATSDVYLRASAAQVAEHVLERTMRRKPASANDEITQSLEEDADAISMGAHERLRGYLAKSSEDPDSAADLVNIMQNPSFMVPLRRRVAPTLMRGSLLVSLRLRRLLTRPEYLLIQGILSPSIAGELPISGCNAPVQYPFTVDIADGKILTDAQFRSAAGNGMHLQHVGFVFLWTWAMCCVEERGRAGGETPETPSAECLATGS